MSLGFSSLKDLLDVLLVPISVGLMATLWPMWLARRRRANFENLIRRELQEAAPQVQSRSAATPWPDYLIRRFTHEDVITHPSGNTDFVLSLDPELSYHLSQMWIEFEKAKEESQHGKDPSQQRAEQFCWHMSEAVRFLDRQGKPKLQAVLLEPWRGLLDNRYTDFMKRKSS